jgi:hypothetical protein
MKIKSNQDGVAHMVALLVVVAVTVLGVTGWLIYVRQKSKTDDKTKNKSATQQEENKVAAPKQETKSNAPEGWVQYQDKSSSVSFYYPADWDKSEFHVYKTSVSETVKGTNFGPYSAEYVFKKADNKWYAVNSDGIQVAPYAGYTTVTKFPVSTYSAVYGYTGEGGGASYFAVFTDGTSSYLIELPKIIEATNPAGLSKQKESISDLVKTIELSNN